MVGEAIVLSLNFSLSIFFIIRNVGKPKITHFGKKFKQIEILNTDNLLCVKLATFCRKAETSLRRRRK